MRKRPSRFFASLWWSAGLGLFLLALVCSPQLPQFEGAEIDLFFTVSTVPFLAIYVLSGKSRRAEHLIAAYRLPVIFSFLIPYLFSKEWWRKEELLACSLCATYSLLLYRTISKCFPFSGTKRTIFGSRQCDHLLLAASIFYLTWTSYYTIIKHYKLLTNGFDMAIFHNAILNATRGTLFHVWCVNKMSFFTMHFEPTLSFIVPLYFIAPRVETLLIFQAAILAFAAVPLYAFAKARLGSSGLALIIAVVYLLHPGLHLAQFYDFHEMSFLPLFLFSMFYFHQKERTIPFFFSTLCCLGIKEDFSIFLFFVFLFIGLSDGWKGYVLWALLVSVSYGWFADWSIRALGGDPHRLFPAYYFELRQNRDDGVLAMLLNALFYPENTLHLVFKKEKILYLLQLFLPVAMLPLLRPKTIVLFVYPLALSLLASSSPLYSLGFQYSLYFVAPALIALVYFFAAQMEGTSWLRCSVRGSAASLIFLGFVLSYQYGVIFNQRFVIWQRENYQGWLELRDEEYARYLELRALVTKIPADAEGVLCAGELCAHLEHVYDFHQIEDEYPRNALTANYVLLGRKRQYPEGRRAGDPVWEKAGLKVADETQNFTLYRRESE